MNHIDGRLYLIIVGDEGDVFKKEWIKDSDQLTLANNNTVLHLACQFGSSKCVDEILSAYDESRLLQTNSRGETALHLAAKQGNSDVVKALINKAKSLVPQTYDPEDSSSTTVLQNLIRASNLEVETALHAAVRFNEVEVVELLVKEDPSYSYPPNKYNETPLYLAAIRSYAGVTKIILDNCESPTFGGPNGRTALHAALTSQAGFECVKLLLKKNEDLIRIADEDGWTAFHHAVHNQLYTSIEFLMNVDKYVAYEADKKYKRTPIHVAAYNGLKDMVENFLEYLPDAWESIDGNGQNILHIAVTQNQKSFVESILSKLAVRTLLIQRNKEGDTPLHLIAKFGWYFPALHENLAWNVDWDAVNYSNFTPQDVFYEKQTGTILDQNLVGASIIQSTWDNWLPSPSSSSSPSPLPVPVPEVKTGDVDVENGVIDKKCGKWHKEMVNTHMIVAALTTTVALTAGFAMPGGFDGNQGFPILLRKPAFKTFMVADTLALLFSISSLFLYFITSMNLKIRVAENLLLAAIVLNVVSIASMMVAFIGGTCAVLSHSFGLTISVCIISSLFLLLVFYVSFRVFWGSFKESKATQNRRLYSASFLRRMVTSQQK